MKNYCINTQGELLVKNQKKEFYKLIFGGLAFYIALFFVSLYTIPDVVFLSFLLIFLTFIYSYIFVFVPISLMMKIKKVIKKIVINKNQILFITDREYKSSKANIDFFEVKNRFSGFSERKMSGLLLKTNNGKEFWIIEDFYNNFEELHKSIIKLKSLGWEER